MAKGKCLTAEQKTEKEPDTAAPVTDSEQEDVCENIPADIITENAENVKPDDILPCAVVDAVADQIDRMYDKIAECDRKVQEIKDARANAENDLTELRVFLKENGYGDVVKTLDLNAKRRRCMVKNKECRICGRKAIYNSLGLCYCSTCYRKIYGGIYED